MYRVLVDGERLLATVEMVRPSRAGAAWWRLRWGLSTPQARDPEADRRLFGSWQAAVETVLRAYPQGAMQKYSGRGERLA